MDHAQASSQVENQVESRDTVEANNSKSRTTEHAEMPDIENYEPTDAELADVLASAGAALGDEGLSTEEAEVADMDAQHNNAAHGEYDTLAAEDDILFETSPGESLRRSRPFNHELLTHQHLGVSALGRPVEALIIKNPNRMRRSRKQIPVIEPEVTNAEPSAELKWTDYVANPDEEQDPVLEAWDNIDEMRPAETKTISAHEYHRLVGSLVDGFTQGQLTSYITMKHAQELEAQEAQESQMHPWIQKQTPWQAGYRIELESKKPKFVCSAAIIDKIWKLEVQEQVESLGRALVWVQPVTFRLLTGHGRPVLEAIQREMLNPGNNERLAAKSEESRIGIYAPKAAIPPIIARLNSLAQAVTSTKIPTKDIKKENLTQFTLDSLASITNTIIEKSGSGDHLTVHWIADHDRPKPTNAAADASITPEGPADIVWRLLMAAQSAPEAEADLSSKMITRAGRGKKPKGAVYIDHHRDDRSRSWRDKLRPWTRYTDVVAKTEENSPLPPLQLSTRVMLEELPSSPASEALSVSEVTFATFGHLLHPKDAAKVPGKKNATASRRILSPVIPHPAALTTLSAGDQPVTQSTAIVLHFAPDPTTEQHAGSATTEDATPLPRVRLTLPVDETTDLSNFDVPPSSTLHAVAAQRVQDLLLPGESVDVRLTRQRLIALDTAHQPAMRRFLAASEFNLLEGRLRTPSRVALSLPGGGAEAALYLFMGLEVRQAVETRLGRHHTIRYESVEAGQHGGQRQELSLHRAVPPATAADGAKEGDDGFLQLVEDVAAGHVFSWNDGAALMQRRSSETFTMDMLEDAALDDEPLLLEPEAEETEQPRDDATGSREESVVAEHVEEVPAEPGAQETAASESERLTKETADSEESSLGGEATASESASTLSAAAEEPPPSSSDDKL